MVQALQIVQIKRVEHVVVQVEDESGARTPVDLGRTTPTSPLTIAAGDLLKARGPLVRSGEKSVLLAGKARVNGLPRVNRRVSLDVDGVVALTRVTEVRGREHLLVLVRNDTKDGTWLVDLGPRTALNGLDLATGDEVSLDGSLCRREDLRFLLTSVIEYDDKRIEIDRLAGVEPSKPGHK